MSMARRDQVIALAALFQSAQMVVELAKSGRCEPLCYESLVDSLFVFEPKSALDVYDNDLCHLHTGLRMLSRLNDERFNKQYADTIRYALSLIALQKQLSKQGDMLKVIHTRLKHLNYKRKHFSIHQDNNDIARSISGLYQDTLSTLKFRIQVTGNMQNLTQPAISDKIRTMLFTGIRAAMLWRQLNGRKWQLIFGRTEIARISRKLLEETHSKHH